MEYIAHINAETAEQQKLIDHLNGTAYRAKKFAEKFGAEEIAAQCGMLHDIGKYSCAFQRRIRGSSEQVDHSTAGAQVAFKEYRDVPAAFCISGHHGGLPDGGSRADTGDMPTFQGKMKRVVGRDIEDFGAYSDEVSASKAVIPMELCGDNKSRFFFVRMLYSCLVDADFLDTEEFMSGGGVARGGYDDISALWEKLELYISSWRDPKTELNKKRCEILSTLIDSGEGEKGLFSLTVPTGGGKTVSSMAFALRHALTHGMSRIIYVIPYTSIIEQTQAEFEKIFGEENVVAHYADVNYEADESKAEMDRRRLSTENWDAPIIITTSVQFFESLFSNRSSRCRKLHNISDSVIIFDEAQMLPVPVLRPCVYAISQLVGKYGCSAVLCTATQPSLARLFKEELPNITIRELCPDLSDMFDVFRRVKFVFTGKLSDDELAERLLDEKQVLCVVNSKRQAQQLFLRIKSGCSAYHLSTAMTAADRQETLSVIRTLLKDGKPCRVVSTSLIEAGVDVDFPVVYRALAGLDSMIQAGGRCNRERKRPPEESCVYLFETDEKPPRAIEQNIGATRHVMRSHDDILSPAAVEDYFSFLFYTLKDDKALDLKDIIGQANSAKLPFATVASQFKIIDNADRTVFIPIDEGERLVHELTGAGPGKKLLRKLGRYSVGVYPEYFESLIASGAAVRVAENAAVLHDMDLYDRECGLKFSAEGGKALFG